MMDGASAVSDSRIRAVTVNDVPALCRLFETVFGHPRTPEYWHWKYGASADLCEGFGACPSLVVVDADDVPVAHAGAVTLPGWHRGEPIPFVQVCDVMVHPRQRGGWGRRNLFTVLLRALLDSVADQHPQAFRYGFPGERPFLLGERAGVYERITTAVEFDVQGRASRLSPWRAAPLAWDDRRLDQLWTRLSPELSLALIRNGAYLRWRYADHPEHTYQLFGVIAWGRLTGWVVIREWGGYAHAIDFLTPAAKVNQGVQAAASCTAVSSIAIWACPMLAPGQPAASRRSPIVVAHMAWHSGFALEKARSSLHYTMGDVDIF